MLIKMNTIFIVNVSEDMQISSTGLCEWDVLVHHEMNMEKRRRVDNVYSPKDGKGGPLFFFFFWVRK